MVQAQGYRGRLALAYETAYGVTPVSPSGFILPITSSKIVAKQTLIEDNTIRGIRDVAPPGLGNIDVQGPVVVPIDEINVGYWLKGLFGSPDTTDSSTVPYTHTFTPGFTQPSMSLEQQFPDLGQYFLYNGCKVSKFSMAFEVSNQDLQATIDIMGGKETLATTSFLVEPAVRPMTKFGAFMATILDDGQLLANVTKVELTVDTGLDGSIYTLGGGGFRGSLPEGMLAVTGTVSAIFDSMALLNKAIAGATSSIELNLSNPLSGSSLNILLPEIIYERTSPGIDGPKGVSISLPFRAFYNTNANGVSIVATLVNAEPTY
ncbi:phage tail tube protein [Sporomusa termitida]|uniref:Uncharacterized protein n=1 Tax=Sporomusa termitida TaxID=2377 RepID=A0A517DVI7_9FIRM|nr:phage tail tube protein [Sporomusa termitida]QDR81343.1 hypothetical protein SPTER_27220 [Sporomusa termitida]